jgi:nicotinate-nucleotide pyrophosphorylase (carboxylating)
MKLETNRLDPGMDPDRLTVEIIQRALKEDIGSGDLTTLSVVPDDYIAHGIIIVKENGIIAGLEIAQRTFTHLDKRIQFKHYCLDGETVSCGTVVAEITGAGKSVISAERVALNFLQRMSGIATHTRKIVDLVSGTKARILDSRKTAPGLRILDKWAVRLGGGYNHRSGLYDMVLIKDNHIAAAGGIGEAISRVRSCYPDIIIEIEVKNLDELAEAAHYKPDRIMLDNMDLTTLKESVTFINGSIPLEASGNITLQTVADVARTGVDFISIGALTHSVNALDISLVLDT